MALSDWCLVCFNFLKETPSDPRRDDEDCDPIVKFNVPTVVASPDPSQFTEVRENELHGTDPGHRESTFGTKITLDVLCGQWVSSHGAKIFFDGTDIVKFNTVPLVNHPIRTSEEGEVLAVGELWQIKGWHAENQIEFIEAPSRDRMEGARSIVITRANAKVLDAHHEHLNSMGYRGSAKNPLHRGVEGCTPGSMDAKGSIRTTDDPSGMHRLGQLITKWRENADSHLPRVCSKLVIPDCSNRGQTGLSVEHVHYVASSFKKHGFIPRTEDVAASIRETKSGNGRKPHDIPVLVRESAQSVLGKRSIENWRRRVISENGFPPITFYEQNAFSRAQFYTSLGNGHFNQALNLFSTESANIYGAHRYEIAGDRNLENAIERGVPSIVLKSDIPLQDREEIAFGLNAKFDFKWKISDCGHVDVSSASESQDRYTQFEAMSKVLDAVELDCLVRSELGVKTSHRVGR